MTTKAKQAPGPFMGWPGAESWAEGWAPILEANRVALDRWTKVSGSMAEAMLAVSQEMAQFAHIRLKQDVQNCDALSHCHSPKEVLECQHRFAEAATTQYLDEANKLTALMTKIANDGFDSLRQPAA